MNRHLRQRRRTASPHERRDIFARDVATILVSLTPEDRQLFEAGAHAAGLSVNCWLLKLAIQAIKNRGPR